MENLELKTSNLDPIRDDEDSSSDDDLPSTLEVIVEKQQDLEKTVSLIKKEISRQEPGSTQANVRGKPVKLTSEPAEDEFKGLNNFLADNKVKQIIRNVGIDTHGVIEKALGKINSKDSIRDKREAFSLGIKELQMNLKGKKDVGRNSDYNLAMALVGLKK